MASCEADASPVALFCVAFIFSISLVFGSKPANSGLSYLSSDSGGAHRGSREGAVCILSRYTLERSASARCSEGLHSDRERNRRYRAVRCGSRRCAAMEPPPVEPDEPLEEDELPGADPESMVRDFGSHPMMHRIQDALYKQLQREPA